MPSTGPSGKCARATFRVAPWRRCGEIWFASLLWMQFCLENGSLHRGLPFSMKRKTLDPSAILEVPFASSLKLEMPPSWRCHQGRPWMQIGLKTAMDSESTQRGTPNAAQICISKPQSTTHPPESSFCFPTSRTGEAVEGSWIPFQAEPNKDLHGRTFCIRIYITWCCDEH